MPFIYPIMPSQKHLRHPDHQFPIGAECDECKAHVADPDAVILGDIWGVFCSEGCKKESKLDA